VTQKYAVIGNPIGFTKSPDSTEQPLILMDAVEKWYGSFQALQAVTLSVAKARKSCFAVPRAPANPH
jgi:hypothetical protein